MRGEGFLEIAFIWGVTLFFGGSVSWAPPCILHRTACILLGVLI